NCWGYLNVASGIFKRHSCFAPPDSGRTDKLWRQRRAPFDDALDYGAALARSRYVHLIAILGNRSARKFDSIFHEDFYHLIVGNWVVRVFFFYQFFDL